MANTKNLTANNRTPSERRRSAAKAGKASGKARRAKKTLAETARAILDSELPKGSKLYNSVKAMSRELPDEDVTVATSMLMGQINAAARGNANAFRVVRELADEAPREKAPFAADFGLLIGPAFLDAHRAIAAGLVTDIWADGGRGSLKSSWASLEIAYGLMRDPDANALVMQARGVDIRDGTFAQMLWALDMLGVRGQWRAANSARRITHKETGQLILFRGCDDPAKTKSIKVDRGYLKFLWLEEVDQFRGMAEIRTIRQSASRGGDSFVRFYTFNPPRSKDSWANVEAARVESSPDPTEMRVFSSYLEAPKEWLGEQFIADAEALKESDPVAYAHEYGGDSVGVGGEVFTRAAYEPITDDQIRGFDRILAGQDWGWWPDPWALVVSAWDPSTRTLYSFVERGGNRIQPDESAPMVREALTWEDEGEDVFHNVPVRTDDSAPSLIQAHRDAGIMAIKAEKGHRRMESYEWLGSVRWVIDPERCPNLAREARKKTYERTKDGEWLNSIPDGEDHWLDAARYSVMQIIQRGEGYGTDKER